MLADIFGWIGFLGFATCSIPQAILSVKTGRTLSFSSAFLMTYLTATALSLIYAAYKNETVLIFNFIFNLALWSIIIKYKYWPRKQITHQKHH